MKTTTNEGKIRPPPNRFDARKASRNQQSLTYRIAARVLTLIDTHYVCSLKIVAAPRRRRESCPTKWPRRK